MLFLQHIVRLLLLLREVTIVEIVVEHVRLERRVHPHRDHVVHINVPEPGVRKDILDAAVALVDLFLEQFLEEVLEIVRQVDVCREFQIIVDDVGE